MSFRAGGMVFDRLRTERNGRWDHRSAPAVDDLNDLAAVYSLQVDRSNPEVRVSKLALDYVQGNAFLAISTAWA